MIALPPYARLLGLSATIEHDAPVFDMPFAPEVQGRPGFLHGGAIAGLLEMSAILTLRHALGDEPVRLKPINLSIDYLRGGRAKPTRAAATIFRLGRRIANVEASAWQDDPATPIAHARITFLLRR